MITKSQIFFTPLLFAFWAAFISGSVGYYIGEALADRFTDGSGGLWGALQFGCALGCSVSGVVSGYALAKQLEARSLLENIIVLALTSMFGIGGTSLFAWHVALHEVLWHGGRFVLAMMPIGMLCAIAGIVFSLVVVPPVHSEEVRSNSSQDN